MENMFEKTMMTCLQNPASKNTKRSKLNESMSKIKQLTEEDEMDLSYDDVDEVETMDDIQDDVVVVVDPELDADEVEDAAAEAQEIVDGTPEGEVPTTDEYVGDKTYTCPICGNTFFSETEMKEGDACPVCGETPTAFVLVGEVADAEEEPAEDETAPEEDIPADEEVPEEEPEDAEDIPEDDAVEEESVDPDKKKVCPECGKDPCVCECNEELEHIDRKPIMRKAESKKPAIRKESKVRFQIDDSTFNPYLNKFIRENYKNARSFKMTGATLNKNRVLTLECKITFKSGNSKNVKLKTEGFRAFNGKRAYIDFREDGAFKTESKAKVAPFIFTTSMKNNVLKCEGMKYNFVSKISESKKAHVYGKVMIESGRLVRK